MNVYIPVIIPTSNAAVNIVKRPSLKAEDFLDSCLPPVCDDILGQCMKDANYPLQKSIYFVVTQLHVQLIESSLALSIEEL